MQKQLISQLSPTLESKSVLVSERGLTSTQWTEYSENTTRIQCSAVPTSDITAEAVTVDGFMLLAEGYGRCGDHRYVPAGHPEGCHLVHLRLEPLQEHD